MKNILIILLLGVLFFQGCDMEKVEAPEKITSYNDLVDDLEDAVAKNKMMEISYPFSSVQGREIPLIFYGDASDTSRLKMLIFGQQHGNEQSGKEGLKQLVKQLAEGKLENITSNLNLWILPQLNPDGAEKDKRRNGADYDLNRDHLVLSQPETAGLHKLFDKILPEVTLDVHEYSPYSDSWIKYGALKNWDEQLGMVSNPNVSKEIKEISKRELLPFMHSKLEDMGFTFHEYILNGPPDMERLRYSTVDISDGRNSFGLMNTFSYLIEGKNGKTSTDNLSHRSSGQYKAVVSFLEFFNEHHKNVKWVVNKNRKILSGSLRDSVTVMADYKGNGESIELKLKSVSTGEDTIVTTELYHPEVEALKNIAVPEGYLIPKSEKMITEFLGSHSIITSKIPEEYSVYEYEVKDSSFIVLEELETFVPLLSKSGINVNIENYLYVPSTQLKQNLIVLAFEPESQNGLVQYPEYRNCLISNGKYLILRVEKK